MKLRKVEINEFRSIRSSGEFHVGDVTCLVGKNESGKTALLKALYKLNPVVQEHGDFDITDEYPRADVEDYRSAIEDHGEGHAIVVKATYELDEDEVARLEKEYGSGVIKERTFTLSKDYSNTLIVDLHLSEDIAIKGVLDRFKIPADVATGASECKSLTALAEFLAKDGEKRRQAHQSAAADANLIGNADDKLKAVHAADLLAESDAAKKLRAFLNEIETEKGLSMHAWRTCVKPSWPRFLYFDEYYQMVGHVNIETLKRRQKENKLHDSDRPMLGLIELARLNLDELLNPGRTEELIAKLEGASNSLSKKILKFWSQNKHLQVKFDVRAARPGDPPDMRSGTNLWGRVDDTVHRVSTQLGSRSKGFLWFFSFLAWFGAQKKQKEPLILLLDEPGLFLHAKAQADLLAYIEAELKDHHQVLYTTHSPFMIDAKAFDRIRIVEDRSIDTTSPLPLAEAGTKVFTDVLEAGESSLFPLQGALGYEIAQTLFVGPNCLIVEGVSDLLYLQAVSGLLGEQNRTQLDHRWTITPVGGAEKVSTFAALLGSQRGLRIATLIDFQKKDKQRIEALFTRKLLEKSHVLTFAEFTGTGEADVEDMFDMAFYLKLVNEAYGSKLREAPTVEALTSKHPRIIVRLNEFFDATATESSQSFNHYRPARYFHENLARLKNSVPASTLERFEQAFLRLNGLLK
jgi:predicted ATP-dependent endonuclease of OLD family